MRFFIGYFTLSTSIDYTFQTRCNEPIGQWWWCHKIKGHVVNYFETCDTIVYFKKEEWPHSYISKMGFSSHRIFQKWILTAIVNFENEFWPTSYISKMSFPAIAYFKNELTKRILHIFVYFKKEEWPHSYISKMTLTVIVYFQNKFCQPSYISSETCISSTGLYLPLESDYSGTNLLKVWCVAFGLRVHHQWF